MTAKIGAHLCLSKLIEGSKSAFIFPWALTPLKILSKSIAILMLKKLHLE